MRAATGARVAAVSWGIGCESLRAYIAFRRADRPEAPQRRREAARYRNAVQDELGGTRTSAVRRARSASLTDEDSSAGSAPRSAGMQGAIAQWPLARQRHNEIDRYQQGRTVCVEAVSKSACPFPSPWRHKKRAPARKRRPCLFFFSFSFGAQALPRRCPPAADCLPGLPGTCPGVPSVPAPRCRSARTRGSRSRRGSGDPR